jgi:hypothetical protein
MNEPWTFGNAPLAQTEEAAALLRRVAGLAVALEQPNPALDRLIAELRRAETALTAVVPPSTQPRIGAAADGEGRVYLDHARDIGAYNPCFPEYTITVDGPRATGTVDFPIAYEGPPGIVHGGFLALLFDCVVQHHNCDVGVAGKTAMMTLRYRRPAPVATPLRFTIDRTVHDGRIRSVAQLLDGEQVLCEAEVDAVAGDRANLPAVSPRRGPL